MNENYKVSMKLKIADIGEKYKKQKRASPRSFSSHKSS